MVKRYDKEVKARALALLDAGMGLKAVSRQMGIPISTLNRWRWEGKKDLAPGTPEGNRAALHYMQTQLLENGIRLVESLEEKIKDAPLNQRATALNQILTMLLKLSEQLGSEDDDDQVIRIEYQDAETGIVYNAPQWTEYDTEE
jgi:transposase-like protein